MTITTQLDLDTWDLPEQSRWVTGAEEIGQRIIISLRTLLGEWMLDTSVGIPYQDWLTVKPVDQKAIGAILIADIRDVPGVVSVSERSSSYDVAARSLEYNYDVITEDGEIVLTAYPLGRVSLIGNSTPAFTLTIPMHGGIAP